MFKIKEIFSLIFVIVAFSGLPALAQTSMDPFLGEWKGTGNYAVPGVQSGNGVATQAFLEPYAYGKPAGTMYDPVDRKSYPAFSISFTFMTKLNYPDGEYTLVTGYSFMLKGNSVYLPCIGPETTYIQTGTVTGSSIVISSALDSKCKFNNLSADIQLAPNGEISLKVQNAFNRKGATADGTFVRR